MIEPRWGSWWDVAVAAFHFSESEYGALPFVFSFLFVMKVGRKTMTFVILPQRRE
jgi:hypothetical protein